MKHRDRQRIAGIRWRLFVSALQLLESKQLSLKSRFGQNIVDRKFFFVAWRFVRWLLTEVSFHRVSESRLNANESRWIVQLLESRLPAFVCSTFHPLNFSSANFPHAHKLSSVHLYLKPFRLLRRTAIEAFRRE